MKNKGYVLTTDAVIALLFVIGVFIIVISFEFFNPEETSKTAFLSLHYISEDALDVLNKKGVLDELGAQWSLNTSESLNISKNITKGYLDLIIPQNMGYKLEIIDAGAVTDIYSSDNSSSTRPNRSDAAVITHSLRLLVGYKQEKPVYGDVARSYIILRGWYFTEGVWNSTKCLYDPCYCCASPSCTAPTDECPASLKDISGHDVYCFLDNCTIAPEHDITDDVTVHCYGIAGMDLWGTCSTSAHDIKKNVTVLCCGGNCYTTAEHDMKEGVNITCYGDECTTTVGHDMKGTKRDGGTNILGCGNTTTYVDNNLQQTNITCYGEECTTTAKEIRADDIWRGVNITCCGDGDCNTTAEKKIKGDVDIVCYGEECNVYSGDSIEGKKKDGGVDIIGCGNTQTSADKKIENASITCYGEECITAAGNDIKDVDIMCYEECSTTAGHDINGVDVTCCGTECSTTSDHNVHHDVNIMCYAEQCTTHADDSIEGKHKDEGTNITCCGDCDTSAGKKIENVSVICYEQCDTTAGDNIKDVDIMCYEECNTDAGHDLGDRVNITCCGDQCDTVSDHHIHHGVDIMCYGSSCSATSDKIHDRVNMICYSNQSSCTITARNETIEDQVAITCCGEECTTTAGQSITNNVVIRCYGESCTTTAGSDIIGKIDVMCCADQCTNTAGNDIKGKPRITCCGEECTTVAGHDISDVSMTCYGDDCSVYVSANHNIQNNVITAGCGNGSDVYVYADEDFQHNLGNGVYCKGDNCNVYVGANKFKNDVDIYCYGEGCSAVADAISFENMAVNVFCCGAGCNATCIGGTNGCNSYVNNTTFCSRPQPTPICDNPECIETCSNSFDENCDISSDETCTIPEAESCSALIDENCMEVPGNETCDAYISGNCNDLFNEICINGFDANCGTSAAEELLVIRIPYSPPGSKSLGSSNITFYYDIDGDNIPDGNYTINTADSNDTFDPCHDYTNCTPENILDATDFSFAWLMDLINTENDNNTPQDIFPLMHNETINPLGDGGVLNPVDVNSSNIEFNVVHGSNIRTLWGPVQFRLTVWM